MFGTWSIFANVKHNLRQTGNVKYDWWLAWGFKGLSRYSGFYEPTEITHIEFELLSAYYPWRLNRTRALNQEILR